jgi:hypothetical protein
MDEATALLLTLQSTAPDAPTACAGWTAHDLVAHLAAGAAEMAELTETAAQGLGARPTRDFDTREAPFVAMVDDELRGRLLVEAIRLNTAIEALGDTDPAPTVFFSGRNVSAAELTMHGRSEAALHRWDLAGDDETSNELLAQPELTAHAVAVLNTMVAGSGESVTARTTAAAITELRANFGSSGHLDVVLVVDRHGARLELAEPRGPWTATADPATRLLALWGRRATRPVAWSGDPACRALAAFLRTGASTALSETR